MDRFKESVIVSPTPYYCEASTPMHTSKCSVNVTATSTLTFPL